MAGAGRVLLPTCTQAYRGMSAQQVAAHRRWQTVPRRRCPSKTCHDSRGGYRKPHLGGCGCRCSCASAALQQPPVSMLDSRCRRGRRQGGWGRGKGAQQARSGRPLPCCCLPASSGAAQSCALQPQLVEHNLGSAKKQATAAAPRTRPQRTVQGRARLISSLQAWQGCKPSPARTIVRSGPSQAAQQQHQGEERVAQGHLGERLRRNGQGAAKQARTAVAPPC